MDRENAPDLSCARARAECGSDDGTGTHEVETYAVCAGWPACADRQPRARVTAGTTEKVSSRRRTMPPIFKKRVEFIHMYRDLK